MVRNLSITLVAFLAFVGIAFFFNPPMERMLDMQGYAFVGSEVQETWNGNLDYPQSEYPPFATSLLATVYSVPLGIPFFSAWKLCICLTLLLVLVYLWNKESPGVAAQVAVAVVASTLLLGPMLMFARYDFFIGMAILLSLLSFGRGHNREACFFLSVAGALKLVPMLLLPYYFSVGTKRERTQQFLGIIVGSVLTTIASFAILTPVGAIGNALFMVQYHNTRGVQLESLWSGLHMLVSQLQGTRDKLSMSSLSLDNADVPVFFMTLASACVLIGAGVLTYYLAKQKKGDVRALGTLALLSWMLAVSPVLSPQYILWVLPAAIFVLIDLCLHKKPSAFAVLAAVLVLIIGGATQWIYPHNYNHLMFQLTPLPVIVLNIRNLCLLALPFVLLKLWHKKISHKG